MVFAELRDVIRSTSTTRDSWTSDMTAGSSVDVLVIVQSMLAITPSPCMHSLSSTSSLSSLSAHVIVDDGCEGSKIKTTGHGHEV